MKIGYQGTHHSNSYQAAQTGFHFLDNKENIELVPLISSKNVSKALLDGEIDFGVVAVKNSLGGVVEETRDILETGRYTILEMTTIPVHHCLFVKTKDIASISCIASHVQALMQTRETRQKLFPQLSEREISDTAIGAYWLADGTLEEDIAVLCPINAGIACGLTLIAENLEDSDSYTTFALICLVNSMCKAD